MSIFTFQSIAIAYSSQNIQSIDRYINHLPDTHKAKKIKCVCIFHLNACARICSMLMKVNEPRARARVRSAAPKKQCPRAPAAAAAAVVTQSHKSFSRCSCARARARASCGVSGAIAAQVALSGSTLYDSRLRHMQIVIMYLLFVFGMRVQDRAIHMCYQPRRATLSNEIPLALSSPVHAGHKTSDMGGQYENVCIKEMSTEVCRYSVSISQIILPVSSA